VCPADESWPVCVIPHKRGSGYRYTEVVLEREPLKQAKRGRHAPHLSDTAPVPLLAVAQLYRRDVPNLPDTGEGDLLQIFWCPFERHGDSRGPR
jgi:hypothetical protein